MKREVARFDFKAFGQAIKAARKAKGISRNQLADKMNIAPRYIASIENSGQHPSLQIFYELVTLLDVSVDQFFFPNKETDKSTQRRQLETLLDSMDNKDLTVITATAKAIQEVNDALVALKQDDKKYKTNLKVYKLEQKDFDYSTVKYDEGMISYLDLLQKRENLLSLNKQVVSDKLNCNIDYIGLYKATGAKL